MWRREYGPVLGWFLFCGITDGVDGWIARRWNAQSRLGAMLDPIGDKLLLSGSFVVLAIDGAMEWWLAVLVLGRDVVILLFAAAMLLFSKKKLEFPPSWWGKSSTVAYRSIPRRVDRTPRRIPAVVFTGQEVVRAGVSRDQQCGLRAPSAEMLLW